MSLSVAFLLVFWLFELSSYAYTYAVLDDAVAEGVRYAIAHGTDSSSCSGPSTGCGDSTGANVGAVVKAVAANTLHNMTAMTVSVSYPSSSSKPGALVTVTATYTYMPFIKGLGLTPTMSATSQGRIIF